MKVTTKFIRMSGWGHLSLLPHLDISITYSVPTIILEWWVFRIDICLWTKLSNRAMKIWEIITFNRIKKEDEDD